MGLHRYFVNNLVLTGSNTDPAVDGRLDVAHAEIGAAPDKKSMMARVRAGLKLVGFATVLAATPACAQEKNATQPTPAVTGTDSGKAKPTLVAAVDDEWDLGFGDDLAREKAETAQIRDAVAREKAETAQEKAKTAQAEARLVQEKEETAESRRAAETATELARKAESLGKKNTPSG